MVQAVTYPDVFQPMMEMGADTRIVLLHGGRGSGKTTSAALYALINGIHKPLRVLVCRQYQTSIAESIKAEMELLIRKHWLEYHYKSTREAITGRNGTRIVFRGLQQNPMSIRSIAQVDLCIIDEAQAVGRYAWEELRPSVGRVPDSKLIACMNPTSDEDPVWNDLKLRNRWPDMTLSIEANWNDNPDFPDFLEKMRASDERTMLREEYDHMWGGKVAFRSSELVFPPGCWREGTVPDQGEQAFYGLDLGYVRDPTVAVRCRLINGEGPRPVLSVDSERVKHEAQVQDIAGMLAEVGAGEGDIVVTDSQIPPGDWGGPRLRLARKGPDSIMAGIRKLRSCDIVVNPACEQAVSNLRRMRYKRDPKTDEVTNVLVPGDDHAVDAVRYALEDYEVERFKASRARRDTGPLWPE